MIYVKRILIAIDQLAGVILLGTSPDETISAMAHRRQWATTERVINFIFRDPNHCAKAYLAEMRGEQNAAIYKEQ